MERWETKCFNKNGKCFIESDKEYYRPLEVDTLLGNSSKARKELKAVNINFGERYGGFRTY